MSARAAATLDLLGAPWRRPVATVTGAIMVAAALLGGLLARRAGVDLGAASAPLFLVRLDAPLAGGLAVPALACAGGVAGALALARRPGLPATAFAVLATLLGLAVRLGLNTAQRGTDEWTYPLVRGGGTREYPAAFPLVDELGIAGFIDGFGALTGSPDFPVHPAGHPVGATLAAFALDRLGGGVDGLALLLIALGALGAVPVLLLARRLLPEREARVAVLLWALAPATLIHGATSLDAIFVPVAALCATAVLARRALAAAALAAAAFLLSYALALAPLWAALVLGRRGGLRAAVVTGGGALIALAALALVAGYDPIDALRGTFTAYERGIGGRRPHGYWLVGGPAAFLLALGPALGALLLRGIDRATPGSRALAACVVLAAASGVMEAEVERIWQFMVPTAAIAAAPLVASRPRLLALVLGLGALAALAIEALYDTSW